ncbi:MAG: site-specific DNA-methyltransferase [Sphaerochaeta sp.]
MDKMKMSTPDLTDVNIEKIGALFPNVITETRDDNGSIIRAVDFDLLKQALSKSLVEDENERYRLDWPGKKVSLLKTNTPINKTLRPCREESVNFNSTENLYIEGDNFEVLKILQESYLGKIKMIYIDPPYNTGNDFIYKDNFSKSRDDYEQDLGITDGDDGKLFRNTDTNGRYHSDWLSMMYERLLVARDLLREDAVIFISIDDNEVHNLRKICDEVFGEENFIAQCCHKSRASISNDKIISSNHNHVFLYAKSYEIIFNNRKDIGLDPDLDGFSNPDNDRRGPWKITPVDGPGGAKKGNPFYSFLGIEGYYRYSKETMEEKYNDGLIIKTENGLQQKYFLSKAKNSRRTDNTWWDDGGLISTATRKLQDLMGGKSFDTPKPVDLIYRMLKLITFQDSEATILDFFSGSATTAHAVMQFNAEDGGHRKFIMVQLQEPCEENSEAFKAGYKTIAEIGKERIRRAGKIIVDELKKKNQQLELGLDPIDPNRLDIGFRVYKTDSSNMKDVFYHPSELDQDMLFSLESNIKDERTPEDLLTQVILDLGLELTLPIETKQMFENTVYIVQTNALVACFDENVEFKIVDQIAALKPLKVIFRDASFVDDKDSINVEERFKRLSPETKVMVI